jgi:hypothetical protein
MQRLAMTKPKQNLLQEVRQTITGRFISPSAKTQCKTQIAVGELGSVQKVLQKEEGHGSHWGVFMNPVKRKAEP